MENKTEILNIGEASAPVIRTLWNNGRWFEVHPDKIAGTIKKTTNQYGKPIEVVIGTLEDIEKTIKTVTNAYIFPFLEPVNQPKPTKVIKITEAIRLTKEAENNPAPAKVELVTMAEMIGRWSPNVTQNDLEVWAYYQKNRLFDSSVVNLPNNGWSKYIVETPDLNKWLELGLIAFDGKEYTPSYIYYSGNIYEKIVELKNRQSQIESKIGKQGFERQLKKLTESIPEKLRLNAAESERLYLSPLDPFCNEFTIQQLSDGTFFGEPISLVKAFIQWIDNLPRQEYKNGSSTHDVQYHFLENSSFSRNTPESEKISRKRKAQMDGIALFQRFMFEMLTRDDQQAIEHVWNSSFNNWKEIDFSKIPVGFEINRYFKSGPIDPRKALWDGVKFLSANGSGIIAFDVGVGKTMTSILGVAQALYTGQCKRPLIIVPNPTYKKWIEETIGAWDANGNCIVNGVLPQFKDRINDYYNLGVGYLEKAKNNPPKDGTITFITYEGLEKIGLSDKLASEIENEMFTILNQGLENKDIEDLKQRIRGYLGNASADTAINMDEMGWDYVVIDEAHNCKKIFTRVKGRVSEEDKKRNASPYQLSSGEPSGRGIKAFILSQYIMKRNNMRNVVLLTATPFTNSPLEIYSMLALVAYQNLEKRGITNLVDFFDKFINETVEQAVTAKGTIEAKNVIKSFNNKIVLQNIIFSNILYKTGEEANVKRPNKLVLPYLKDKNGILLDRDDRVETALPPTIDQKYWLNEISDFALNGENSVIGNLLPKSYYDDYGRIPGVDLLAINMAQSVTISPYLLKIGGKPAYERTNPTAKEYIESSPKLMYACSCIKTVRNWHTENKEDVSGQVIYMNQGTEFFPLIKDYLVEEIGYKPSEIEIISGGMPQPKKERIKNDFLNGKVKIIIGSATIKEGIDLQNRSTVLYNCALDWNPTDIIQLEGRIWRQGNMFNWVRIVVPLIENSIDVFMFQKLEEKTSRINDIWYRAGRNNVLNVEELNPGELKAGLMTNPAERAKNDVKNEADQVKLEKEIIDNYIKELLDAKNEIGNYETTEIVINNYYDSGLIKLNQELNRLENSLASITAPKEIEATQNKIANLRNLLSEPVTNKIKYAIVKRAARLVADTNWSTYWSWTNKVDGQIKREGSLERIQKNILSKNGLTLMDDFSPIIQDYEKQSRALSEKIETIKSEQYLKDKIASYELERERLNAESRDLNDRVNEFTKYNYLLSCFEATSDCSLERKSVQPKQSTDKEKRLRIVKAKAKALLLLIELETNKLAA